MLLSAPSFLTSIIQTKSYHLPSSNSPKLPHNVSPSSVSSARLSDPKVKKLIANRSDLVMCRKQPGIAIGRLCDKCDGKCPVCDSYVRPTTLVRICDECSFGNYQNKCVVCGGEVSFPPPLSCSGKQRLMKMWE